MGLQHDNPNLPPQSPPRTQRLTADESRAVIALWQQERVEQTGLTDHPAVPDVAEGLDIPIEEVQRLLGEVRARRLEEERALAQEQELSEIRLAEEERRLAEIRRQRAELRREQMHGRRQGRRRQRGAEADLEGGSEQSTLEGEQHEGGLDSILKPPSPFWLIAMAALGLLACLTLH